MNQIIGKRDVITINKFEMMMQKCAIQVRSSIINYLKKKKKRENVTLLLFFFFFQI